MDNVATVDTVDDSNTIETGDWSVKEAAERLGVAVKTVRRYIAAGTIPATKRPGKWGAEYRVTALPLSLRKPPIEEHPHAGERVPDRPDRDVLVALLEERDRQIGQLSELLGAARMRITQLEDQLKLLNAPQRRHWWQRLFGR